MYPHNFSSTATMTLPLLASRLLPDSLQTLSMTHLNNLQTRFWKNLPENVEVDLRLNTLGSGEINHLLLDDFKTRVTHLQGVFSLAHLPKRLFRGLRSVSIKFNLGAESLSSIDSCYQYFASKQLEYVAEGDLPGPCIVSLEDVGMTHVISAVSDFLSISAPSTLQTFKAYHNLFQTFDALPQSLTHLEAQFKGNGPLILPRALKTLKLSLDPDETSVEQLVAALPFNLTQAYLVIMKSSFNWETLLSAGLRERCPNLQHLTLSAPGDPSPLNETFLEKLPLHLVFLEVRGIFEDILISKVPSSILTFIPSRFVVSGALIPSSATEVELNSFCKPLVRVLGSLKLSGASSSLSSIETFTAITAFPSSLTSLSINRMPFRNMVYRQLSMPNLIKLQIPFIAFVDWNAWSMPSLTSLTAQGPSEGLVHPANRFPASLTHLSLPGMNKFILSLPPNLAPQIRRLKTSIFPSNFAELNFTNLEIYKTGPAVAMKNGKPDILAALPPTLVELNFKSTLDVEYLLETVPSIRRYSSTSSQPLTDDTLLQIVPRLDRFKCDSFHIKSFESYLPFVRQDEADDSWELTRFMAFQLQRKIPSLDISPPQHVFLPELDSVALASLSHAWSGVTNITIEQGVKVWSKLGKFLPSTLTTLRLTARGVNAGTPWHLPSSITNLMIDSTCFTLDSYKHLPAGLKTLRLSYGKLLAHHARVLPSTLTELELNSAYIGIKTFSNLPSSLERLSVTQPQSNECFFRGLPESLTELDCGKRTPFSHKFNLLPPKIKVTGIMSGPYPSSVSQAIEEALQMVEA